MRWLTAILLTASIAGCGSEPDVANVRDALEGYRLEKTLLSADRMPRGMQAFEFGDGGARFTVVVAEPGTAAQEELGKFGEITNPKTDSVEGPDENGVIRMRTCFEHICGDSATKRYGKTVVLMWSGAPRHEAAFERVDARLRDLAG